MRSKFFAIVVLLLSASFVKAAGPGIELITNGDFETGTFAAWTVDNLLAGNGDWFIGTPGLPTPLSVIATAPNATGGNFYGVSDQTGPGTHVLRQAFTVPANAVSVTLSYQMFVNDSDNGPIVNPAGLDHNAFPNQHARVDILTAGAAPFSTAPADVVANFYAGVDPQFSNPNPYTTYNFNLTGLVSPGGTYQLRFGEVDNQLFLNQGVDNVSILATVPEPAAMALLVGGTIGLVGWRRR
jgi:hypothetical protein